jgi:hypothetical protein
MQLGDIGAGDVPGAGEAKRGEWGKLPPAMQRDLREARQETISDEYRQQVDAYFRAIAERSRQEQH